MIATLVGAADDDGYARYRVLYRERINAIGRVTRAALMRSSLFRAPLSKAVATVKEK